ncbi:hypothetical protein [Bradyrhizobium uaiense]|uniref:Uncharacterized protein n=1 Tax=Bradyrhizobium uaiense TaxID=2594946 RepID=A0A6P1BG11_9BRAD|nr:hypothetical protein [Bradyrhizobium uaiense]NEU97189.1 hypothetical protein [Bradyrhizobium uaiense]
MIGDITMRQVILDARRDESIVIRVDGNSTCESAGPRAKSDQARFAPGTMRRADPLWFAATLALTCLSDTPACGGAHAQSHGIAGNTLQLAQAKTNPAGDAGPAAEQPQSAEALARELATARRDIELLRGLLTRARDLYAKAEAGESRRQGAIQGAALVE